MNFRHDNEDRQPTEVLAAVRVPHAADGPVVSPALPPRHHRIKLVLVALIGVLGLSLIATSAMALMARTALSDLQRDDTFLPTKDETGRPTPAAPDGPLNMLLLGVDGYKTDMEGTRDRSDSIMLAHIPADRSKVYLISVPRDVWFPVHGSAYAKINAAFSDGGPALTVRTIEDLLLVRIDHVATIDFAGFIMLTESVGGVTVDNPVASQMKIYNEPGFYNWPEGKVTIQGKEALQFVRQRKELLNGDLDRAKRQRATVRALMDKLLSAGVLANPATMQKVMAQVSRSVTLDSQLTSEKIAAIALAMRITSGKDIESIAFPIAGFGTVSDGQSVDVIDEQNLQELRLALVSDTLDTYVKAHANDDPTTGRIPPGPLPEGFPQQPPYPVPTLQPPKPPKASTPPVPTPAATP